MACPICVSPEGTAITAGIRAGAGELLQHRDLDLRLGSTGGQGGGQRSGQDERAEAGMHEGLRRCGHVGGER